jgi:hypothetical protein
MLTCGDLGGQACPLVDDGPCPRGGRIATMPACHPMRMAVRLAHTLTGYTRLSKRTVGEWIKLAAEVSDE